MAEGLTTTRLGDLQRLRAERVIARAVHEIEESRALLKRLEPHQEPRPTLRVIPGRKEET
ncbi:MAG: hypothetical protein ACRDNG_03080 [Gaiellaceae bacterium]